MNNQNFDNHDMNIKVKRSQNGKTVYLIVSSDIPITIQQFIIELEQYLFQIARAAKQRINLKCDH